MRELPPAGLVTARSFNIGTGIDTSVLELIERLGRIAGVTPRIEFEAKRPGEVERSGLVGDKLNRLLGWKPQVTLDEGLARTYEWVRKESVR